MKKSVCLSLVLASSLFVNEVKADVRITPLKDNDKIFSLLKEYQIYTDNCKIYLDRYSVIEGIEYYDMQNNLKTDGTIVVMDALADNVVKIFSELKKMHFNINSIHPTALYKKNWHGGIEMPDDFNGTESFVCREVDCSKKKVLSLHAFGTALDVNFLQNPCVFIDYDTNEIQKVVPTAGVRYLNRSFNRKGKLEKDIGKVNDDVVKIFKKYGYDIWGGYWDFPIDYQHFQVSNKVFAKLLMYATKSDAKRIFDIHTRCVNMYNKSLVELAEEKGLDLLEKYKENAPAFIKEVGQWCTFSRNKVVRRK